MLFCMMSCHHYSAHSINLSEAAFLLHTDKLALIDSNNPLAHSFDFTLSFTPNSLRIRIMNRRVSKSRIRCGPVNRFYRYLCRMSRISQYMVQLHYAVIISDRCGPSHHGSQRCNICTQIFLFPIFRIIFVFLLISTTHNTTQSECNF